MVAITLLAATTTALPLAHAQPATTSVRQDFNGDGYSDLAVAAPQATIGGRKQAGYVAVLYGSATGPKTSTKQVVSQNTAGVPGTAEEDDWFGSALTTADLDGDGYADLVVGVGGEDTTSGTNSGYLEVMWGGPKGLAGGATLAVGTGENDNLGSVGLVAGDFDGDGASDVAAVTDNRDLRVLTGPFGRDGVASGEEYERDQFDRVVLDLAAGDLNGDGITDVAATANDADEWDSRLVQYWTGTRDGLMPYQLVTDNDGAGLQGGENLDIGDVNGDGYEDLVVGRAIDGYDSDLDTPLAKGGRVTYIPGSADGPVGVRAKSFNQDSSGVPGTAEKGDHFGSGVAVGDIDGDGYADVSVGVPFEDFDGAQDAGTVVTLRGTASGLTGTGAKAVSQNTAGVPGTAEWRDHFGWATHLVDANHDGRAELSVGAPGENATAGSVWVFRSTASGVTPTGSYTFGAGTLGTVAEGAHLGEGFTY